MTTLLILIISCFSIPVVRSKVGYEGGQMTPRSPQDTSPLTSHEDESTKRVTNASTPLPNIRLIPNNHLEILLPVKI